MAVVVECHSLSYYIITPARPLLLTNILCTVHLAKRFCNHHTNSICTSARDLFNFPPVLCCLDTSGESWKQPGAKKLPLRDYNRKVEALFLFEGSRNERRMWRNLRNQKTQLRAFQSYFAIIHAHVLFQRFCNATFSIPTWDERNRRGVGVKIKCNHLLLLDMKYFYYLNQPGTCTAFLIF